MDSTSLLTAIVISIMYGPPGSFKSESIEGPSKACDGKPRIYYFVDGIGENKSRGKFEAN